MRSWGVGVGRKTGRRCGPRRGGPRPVPPFGKKARGVRAVSGRPGGVADLGRLHFSGLPAWLIWVFVHINFLIEFDNKLKVMTQWGWNYVTRRQGARLITGEAEPVWQQLPLAPVDPAE